MSEDAKLDRLNEAWRDGLYYGFMHGLMVGAAVVVLLILVAHAIGVLP